MVSLGGRGTNKTMNSHNEKGKNEIFLKTVQKNSPQFSKHAFFAIGMSRKQIAKACCQKPV